MAWNEQYARILEQMKKNSVTNSEIAGADIQNDEPDCLFYTNFSRETAKSFYDLFEEFNNYYKSNPSLAVDRLKTNLKMQIEAMESICPIEVVLYASRLIREHLGKRPIKNAMITIIQQYIASNLKSVQYILSGWEWPQILGIVIEACGKTNDDAAIKMAMNYCERISKKFVDKNDNDLMKSYIAMIEYSQNENYLDYVVEIATMQVFEEDNTLGEFLIKELRNNQFLKLHNEIIAEKIYAKTNSQYLKRSLEKIVDNTRRETSINVFNMNGLNYEHKVKQVEAMDFTKNTSSMLKDFERSRESDDEIVLLMCKKVLKDIPSMYGASDKNVAMMLVGTKGARIRANELIDPILDLQTVNSELKVMSMIALTEIDQKNYTLEAAMNQIVVDSDIESWEWAVGKYFRFRKIFFAKNLMRAFNEKLLIIEGNDVAALLGRLFRLIKLFNGNNSLLSTQQEAQEAIFELITQVLGNDFTEKTAEKLTEILDFMLQFCPNRVLEIIDDLKKISAQCQYENVVVHINEVIIKGDLAREPD